MDPCSPDLLISANTNDESSEGTSIPGTPSLHYKISSSLSWNTEVSWKRKGALPCPPHLPSPCKRLKMST